ncbi:hypothetical protein E8E11_006327 [Didymella keratinophila]|nr:hypothetical protein E8E11_006327 [Didymella keratinophila]
MNHDKTISSYNTVSPYDDQKKTNEHVCHSEIPQEPDVRFQSPSHRSFITKLGLWNIFVLFSGAVASFLAMAFLAFLWAGSETARKGDRTPLLWFDIVYNGWATRVVTVASVLIRIATAAQMGVFAALVAAWILETTGASAEHLPMLSIIRTVNNGPQSHVWNVFHSLRVGARPFYSLFVVLAIFDALALQFTSTLLITDFQSTTIVPGKAQDLVYYGAHGQYDDEAGNVQAGNGVDFFQSAPSTYARFAEWAEQPRMEAEYADTGATIRAFLPFGESETRAVLRSYEGPATVVDSRVRCVLPSITIHNVTWQKESGSNSNYEIAIAGKATVLGAIPGSLPTEEDDSAAEEMKGEFLIGAVARIYWNKTTDWRLSYAMAPYVSDIGGFSNNVLDPTNAGSAPLLLINATGDGWQAVLDQYWGTYEDIVPIGPYAWNQTSSGLWANLKPSNVSLDIGLSATLCFANFVSNNYNVRMDDGTDFSEPKNMSWMPVTKAYSTGPILKMLNTSSQSLTPRERGILRLHPPADGNWTALKIPKVYSDYVTEPVTTGLRKLNLPVRVRNNNIDDSWGATAAFTAFSSRNGVHKTHSAIFQDVIKITGNPALAFQAFFHIIMQMTYYDLQDQFDIANNASYSTSFRVEVPNQWIGFGVVMGLLAIHAMLIVTAVVLFLANTDHSFLGNAWQAVAQVSSNDTMDTMHRASNMTDLEVKRLLRMNSCEDNDVVLRTGAGGGRSQAVYRRGTGDSD